MKKRVWKRVLVFILAIAMVAGTFQGTGMSVAASTVTETGNETSTDTSADATDTDDNTTVDIAADVTDTNADTVENEIEVESSTQTDLANTPSLMSVSGSLTDENISVSDDNGKATWTSNGTTITGTVTGWTINYWLGQSHGANDGTLTITIPSDAKYDLSFAYSYVSTGTVTIDGATLASNMGNWSKRYETGGAVEIYIKSGEGADKTTKIDLTNIKLTKVKENPEVVFNYSSDLGGTYTVDDVLIEKEITLSKSAADTYTVNAVAQTGYVFVGWIVNGILHSSTAAEILAFSEDSTVYPLFVKETTPVFLLKEKREVYTDLNLANNAAVSSGDTIVLINGGTLVSGNYTISDGVTFLLPYSESALDVTDETDHPHINANYINSTYAFSQPGDSRTYLTMSVDENTTITIENGARLVVGGEIGCVNGGTNLGLAGQTAGKHSDIKLNGNIVVESGGVLSCVGYIYSDISEETGEPKGSVTAEGTVYEPFIIVDYSGGTYTSKAYTNGSGKVAPFNRYSMQNIQANLTLKPSQGAALKGYCDLYARESLFGSTSIHHKATSTIVGSGNGLINIQNGTISFVYNKNKYATDLASGIICAQIVIDLGEGGQGNYASLNMNVAGTSINTSTLLFPVPYNCDIILKSGTFTINNKLKLLPGAMIRVNEGATLNLTGELIVYDGFITAPFQQQTNHTGGYPSGVNLSTKDISERAHLIINGSMNLQDGSKFGGLIETTSNTGVVNVGNITTSITSAEGLSDYKNDTSRTLQALVANGSNGVSNIESSKTYYGTCYDGESFLQTGYSYVPVGGGDEVTALYTNAITTYGKWVTSYNVTLINEYANNPEVFSKDYSPEETVAPGEELATQTRNAYKLVGWEDRESKEVYPAVNGGDTTSLIDSMPRENLILYAKWEPETYAITYYETDGSVMSDNGDNPTLYTVETETFSLKNPTKAGYDFAGWTGSNGDTPQTTVTIAQGSTGEKNYTANWTAHKYSVLYNGNGSDGGSTATSEHEYDTAKALTANGFTKLGYTFAGWATSENGEVVYADKESVENLTAEDGATVTLYAKWTPNTYTIQYLGNGETSGMTSSSTHTYDSEARLTVNGFSKTGYTFSGWSKSVTGDVEYTDQQLVSNLTTDANGVINLYAVWTGIDYEVEYIGNGSDGGSTVNSSHVYGTQSSLTTNGYTRTGYHFVGWNTVADGSGTSYTDGQAVSTLTTEKGTTVKLYAQWAPNDFTILFNANNGTDAKESQSVTYAEGALTLFSSFGFEKEHYSFAGWSASANSTNPEYLDGHSMAATPIVGEHEGIVDLYAIWTAKPFAITYDLAGGALPSNTSNPSTYTVEDEFTLFNPTKTGYMFAGWTGSNGDEPQTTVNIPQGSNGAKSFTANWTAYTYSLVFNSNGGTGSMNSLPFTYGEAQMLTENAFVNPGHTFAGWNTVADGSGVAYADKVSVSNLTTTNNGTVTLYAQWTANDYTIVFDGNGSDEGTMDNMAFKYAEEKSLTENAFTRVGYTFAGWNTAANGSGDKYTDKATVSNLTTEDDGTVTLYAQWTAHTYSVEFNANGGTGNMDDQSFAYGTAQSLAENAFTRAGYTFAGWDTAVNGGGDAYEDKASVSNLTTTNNGTVTLYAQWTANTDTKYTIEYYYMDVNGDYPDTCTSSDKTKTGTTDTSVTLRAETVAILEGFTFDADNENAVLTGTITGDEALVLKVYAKRNAYKFTTNVDGVVSEETYLHGASISAPEAPTKTGYTFTGWFNNAACEGDAITLPTSMPIGDVTYYAGWRINQYTITFHSMGGEDVDSITENYNASVTLPDGPARTGYTFTGWYLTEECTGTAVTGSVIIPAHNDTVYYAGWRANTYTVVYDGNEATDGSTVKSTHTYNGTEAASANGFKKLGYTFAGWNTVADGSGTTIAAGEVVSNLTATDDAEVTLYAQWRANKYTVVYDGNEATDGTTANTEHTYNGTEVANANGFEKTGYTFIGWNIQPNGSGTAIAAGEVVSNLTATDGDKVTLYAQWTANKYTVVYDGNEATNGTTANTEHTYNGTEVANVNGFEKTGYTFAGWNTQANGSGTAIAAGGVVSNLTTTAGAEVKLYAQWTANNYTITFHANDGSDSEATTQQTFTYDQSQKLKKNEFEKVGYTFVGWATSAVSTTVVYTDEYTVSNLSSAVNGNVDLFAVWQAGTNTNYTVKHHLQNVADNGYTEVEDDRVVLTGVTEGDTNVAANTYDGFTVLLFEQETIAADGSTVVDIYYDRNIHTVTWMLDENDSAPTQVEYRYGAAITIPETLNHPLKTGYTFDDWYVGNSKFVSGTTMPDADVTVIANWNINQYYVTWTVAGPGETEKDIHQVEYDYAETVTVYQPSKEGYTLSPWYTGLNYETVAQIPTTMPAVGQNFYAYWIPNQYTVVFDTNAGDTVEGMVTSVTHTYDDAEKVIPAADNLSKVGYSFKEWNTKSDGTGTAYKAGTVTADNLASAVGEEVTLYAIWTPNQYTVTFDTNAEDTVDGTVASVTHTYDDAEKTIPSAEGISKEGYAFKEWNTKSDGTGTAYKAGKVTADNLASNAGEEVTLFAIWTPNTYTVTFNDNDATTGEMSAQTFIYDAEESLTENAFAKEGYHFIGWATKADGSVEYTDQAKVKNLSSAVNGNVTLYAVWEINTYTVLFQSGTDDSAAVTQKFTDGKEQALRANTFEKLGYHFAGWKDVDGAIYEDEETFALSNLENEAQITLTATWEPNTDTAYTVNYHFPALGDGEATVESKTYYGTTDTTVEAPQITKEGFSAPDIKTITIAADGNASVDYTYTRNQYDLTWDVDGVTSTEQIYYQQAIVTPTVPEKEGHTFAGWVSTTLGAWNEQAIMPAETVTYTATWTTNSYTLSWMAEDMETITSSVLYGTEITAPANPSRTGYSFGGWYADSEFKTPVITFGNMPAADVTYYGKWIPNTDTKYTVEHCIQGIGANAEYTLVEEVTDHLTGTTGATITPDTKVFEGFTAPEKQEVVIKADGSLVVKYHYTRNQYTVTWKTNNGLETTTSNRYYEQGILAPTTPSKPGYTFDGWYAEETFETKVTTFGTMPASNVTYHGKWTPITYGITYNMSGGSWLDDSVVNTTYTIETETFELPIPEKEGYTFIGWTGSNGSNAELSVKIEKGSIGAKTYTANFVANTYQVIFDGNDATFGSMENQILTYDADLVALSMNQYEKTGYTFDGWRTEDGTLTFKNGEKVQNLASSGTITLYAVWTINKYTMSFDGNEGDVVVTAITKDYDSLVDKPTDPSRTGYLFTGWYTNDACQGDAITWPTKMPAGDVTYYAGWEPITYKVVFDSNDGQGTMESMNFTYDEAQNLPENLFTKEGYKFIGWQYEDVQYDDLEAVKNLTDKQGETVTLTARWQILPFTMTFAQNNGQSNIVKTQDYNSAITPPANPYRDGYRFDGWYDNAEIAGTPVTLPSTMPAVDKTYYAGWTSYLELLHAIPVDSFDDAVAVAEEEDALDLARSYYALMNDEQIAEYTSSAEDSVYADHYRKLFEVIEAVSVRDLRAAVVAAEEGTNETLVDNTYGQIATLTVNDEALHVDAMFIRPDYPAINMLNINFLVKLFGYSEIKGVVINDSTTCEGNSFTQFDIMLAIAFETMGRAMGYEDIGVFADYLRQHTDIFIDELDGYSIKATVLATTPEGIEYTQDYTLDFFNQYHDVIWVQNNGQEDVHVSTAYQSEITLPTEPTKTGYTFAGWNTKADGTGDAFAEGTLMGKTKVSYYAQWDINQYTISFDTKGGSEVADITVDYGAGFDLPKNPTKTGYTFAGWFDNESCTGTAVELPETMPAKDTTYYAGWTVNQYTITYNGNGGTVAEVSTTADYGKEISKPTIDPTRTGYTFTGWYTDSDCTNAVSWPVTMPVNGATYYAGWNANTYKVTLDATGGTLTGGNEVIVTYGEQYGLPAPTRTGYTFLGWYLEDGTQIKATDIVDITEDIELTARWEVGESYDITYNLENGTWAAGTNVPERYNVATDTFTLPAPVRTGYTFLGWTGSNGDTIQKEVTVEKGTTGDLSYKAHWDINQYTIAFEANGGTAVADIKADYQAAVTAPADPIKTGHTFTGWYADENCTGDPVTIPTAMPAEDVTYYAGWEINKYTIDFEENGGTVVRSITAEYNAAITAPADPTKEGHTFTGWYADENCAGDPVTIPVTMPAENVVYYAGWEVNEYSITFDSNGGSDVETLYFDYGEGVTAPEDPVRVGYTFAGWDAELPATMPAENLTFTAKWTINTYNIIYIVDDVTYKTQPIAYGATITPEAEPTKVGYTFSGWSTIPEKMPAYTVTVTGKFTANTYTVTYDAAYDMAPTIDSREVTYNSAYGTLPTVERTGYTFTNWFLNGAKVTEDTVVKTAEDHTLIAGWAANMYRVNLDANGGTCDVEFIDVTYDGTYAALPTPVLEGYDFVGWFDGNVQVSPEQTVKITQTQNLVARWNAAGDTPYKVEHYQKSLDGQYALVETDELTGATEAQVQATQKSYEGFYFNEKDSVASGEVLADGSLVLKLYYDRESYAVVWNIADKQVTETYLYNQPLIVPDATRADDLNASYTFIGWGVTLPETVFANATYTAQYELYYEASINDVTYRTLELALEHSVSGDMVVLEEDITLTDDITIPTGVNLLIPCMDDDWGYNLVDNGKLKFNHDGTDLSGGQGLGPNAYLYRTLTVPKDVTITVDGNILINSVSGRPSGGTYEMDITGGYAQINLDGDIVVNNGGNLDCFGYIKGTGSVTAKNGGSVGDLYVVRNWRGGSQALEMYQSIYDYDGNPKTDADERQTYPMNEYDCHNIETDVIVEYGGSYDGNVKMNANAGSGNAYYHTRFPQVNVVNGLIRLTEEDGYVVRSYDETTGIETYTIYGGATFAESSLNISGVDLSTKDFVYPIDGDVGFVLKDGDYYFAQDYKFLPGEGMRVCKDATLTVNDAVHVAFYEEFNDPVNTGDTQYPFDRDPARLYIEEGAKFTNAGMFGGHIITESPDILIGDYPTWGMNTYEANGYCNGVVTLAHELQITREGYTWRYGDPVLGEVENSVIWNGADYTALKAALATVPADLDVYSDETADPLEAVLDDIVYGLGKDKQDQVDTWAEQVTKYVSELKLREVTVVFASNGGTCATESITVTYGDTYGTLPTPEYYGFKFLGWYDSDNVQITDTTVMEKTDNQITLTAKWEKIPADYTAVNAAIAAIPKDMTGYTAESVQAVYDAEDAVDMTLGLAEQVKVDAMAQAILDAIDALEYVQIKVSFDTNGGEAISTTFTLQYKDAYPYDELPTPIREGYDFIGWYTAKEGGTEIKEGTLVTSVTDVTLYAKWTDSTADDPADYSKVNAAIAKIPADRAPYTAASLNKLDVAVDAVVYDLTIDRQADVDAWAAAIEKAIAELEYKTITVYFDPVDGTCDTGNIKVTYGTAVEQMPTATKEYHKFLGWYTAKVGGDKVVASELSTKTANLTLYAQYELLPADYGAIEAIKAEIPADLRCYSDETVAALNAARDQIEEGYTADKQTIVDRWASELQTALDNLTYRTMVMTYDARGGKVLPKSVEVTYNDTITWLPTPERDNHIFNGWFTSATDGVQVVVGTKITEVENFSIYAQWTQIDADYTKVYEALEKIPEVAADRETAKLYYTEESVDALFDAVDAVVYNLDAGFQSQVNNWASDINKAREGLKGIRVKVLFNYNGGTESTTYKYVSYTSKYGTLPETTRTGYEFLGWYTAQTGGEKVTSSTQMLFNKAHTLYAHWSDGKADYSGVEAAIARIPSDMTNQIYTQESIDAVNAAVDAVIYDLTIDKQAKVDAWAVAINAAVDALEKRNCDESGFISDDCASEHFKDIDQKTAWYHLDVDYVVAEGIMNGTEVDEFSPEEITTRGMIVTMLYRLSGEQVTAAEKAACPFVDVNPNEYYADAIAWAYSTGVVLGTSATEFEPETEITREQMITMLYRYADYFDDDVDARGNISSFTDVTDVSDYAKHAVQWGYAEGLLKGDVDANGKLVINPQGEIPRCQAAAFIHRYCEQ